MTRVTPDSNILVSAIVFGGRPGELLEMALRGEVELVVSADIADETCGVLRDKFGFSDERMLDSRERIVEACRMIPYALPSLDAVPDDPDDNRIVECAVEAKSDVIVTGDKHLLKLKSYDDIQIMSLADFLAGFPARSR